MQIIDTHWYGSGIAYCISLVIDTNSLEEPWLDHQCCKFQIEEKNVDPTSCVTQTIETIGVPFPSANKITLEMICNAMMQVKSNKSMTAYQCYIQDTADLRDMKGFDLPATILSSVSSLDTP